MRGVLVGCLLLLAACGFEPLHGEQARGARSQQLESVQILTDTSRAGQLLKAEIEDQVNPTALRAEKPYLLTISVSERELSLFINLDGTSSRGDMQYVSTYTLTQKRDGKVLDQGELMRVSSYNISENADYATFVSREDARRRGIIELARAYQLRLANLLPRFNDEIPVSAPVVPETPAPLLRPLDNHNHETNRSGF